MPAPILFSGSMRHATRRRTTFGDLVGQLEEFRVECEKCGRAGRERLIAECGPEAKVPDWLAQLSADCPKRQTASISDRCAAHCPDLVPVFRVSIE
jgi:hypothetical protein